MALTLNGYATAQSRRDGYLSFNGIPLIGDGDVSRHLQAWHPVTF